MKVAIKFNRCVEFTLADGTLVTAKVLGEKPVAAVQAKQLVAEFAPVVVKEKK